MRNDMTINGKSLWQDYGLILQSFALGAPEVLSNYLDVPGGSPVDMTEAAGVIPYGNRECEFVAVGAIDGAGVTRFLRDVHGRRLPFWPSWDSGHELTGRFSASVERPYNKAVAIVTMEVVADPWRMLRGGKSLTVNAAGGVTVPLESGEKPVQPVITVRREAIAIYNGESVTLQPGTWRVEGWWLEAGENQLYINTLVAKGDATLEDIWGDVLGGSYGKTVAEWCWTDAPHVPAPLSQIWDDMLESLYPKTWAEISNPVPIGEEEFEAAISYDWGDI